MGLFAKVVEWVMAQLEGIGQPDSVSVRSLRKFVFGNRTQRKQSRNDNRSLIAQYKQVIAAIASGQLMTLAYAQMKVIFPALALDTQKVMWLQYNQDAKLAPCSGSYSIEDLGNVKFSTLITMAHGDALEIEVDNVHSHYNYVNDRLDSLRMVRDMRIEAAKVLEGAIVLADNGGVMLT